MPADRNALLPLPVLALAGALLLAALHLATAPRIAATRQQVADRIVLDALMLPPDTALSIAGVAPDASLALRAPKRILLARRHQQLVAIVVPVAIDGYVAPIELIVGIAPDGTVTAVRATAQRETAGIGDRIAADDNAWLQRFIGHAFAAEQAGAWDLRSAGGDFDQITGATITSRAVVEAVRNALQYFAAHREQLLQEAGNE